MRMIYFDGEEVVFPARTGMQPRKTIRALSVFPLIFAELSPL